MESEISAGILQARKKLNTRLTKAGDAVQKADKGLNAAITVYTKAHAASARSNKLVPYKQHVKWVGGITKAREKLTKKLLELRAIEDEWRHYYRT